MLKIDMWYGDKKEDAEKLIYFFLIAIVFIGEIYIKTEK